MSVLLLIRERAFLYSKDAEFRVLEVGGGDGRLTHFLLAALAPDEAAPVAGLTAIKLYCTDDGSLGRHLGSPCRCRDWQ
jgi:hypothetical protein